MKIYESTRKTKPIHNLIASEKEYGGLCMVMEMQHETCNIQHLRSPSGRLGMKPALLRGLRILLLSKSSLLVLADLTMSLLLAL